MRGRIAPFVLVLAAAVPAPARAAVPEDAGRLAASLRADPVHVDAGARPRLSAEAAGQVRLRIAHSDLGRIRVAVVSDAVKRRAGGLDALSNAITARLQRPGTLLMVAGRDWWLNTSYAPGRVIGAVQRAANSKRGLRRQLLAAVDRIAAADPRPGAHPTGAGGPVAASGRAPAPTGTAPTITVPGLREVGEGAKTGLILLGGAILAGIVALIAWVSLRAMSRRREG